MEWLHIIKTIVASYGRNWKNVHTAGVEQIVQWGLCRDTVRPVFAPVLRLAFSRTIGYVHTSNASPRSILMTIVATHLYKRQQNTVHKLLLTSRAACVPKRGKFFGLAGALGHDLSKMRSSANDQSKCSRLLRLTFTAWPLLTKTLFGLVTHTSLKSVCVGGYALLEALREFPSVLFEPPTLRVRDTQCFSSCKVYIKKPPTVEVVLRFISLSFTVFLYASETFLKRKNSFG